jgi:probable rRNA maturation factor
MAPGDQRRARPRLAVSVTDERGRALRGTLAGAPPAARGTVCVAVVSDARVRRLNREYRGKDYATDVLSFPDDSPADAPEAGGPHQQRHLGDVVIARGMAARQAREAGHPEWTELRVLALHGLLHLLGYDHETDTGEMARIEKRLRRKGRLREGLIERA